ncbi:MAG: hypothetical protein EBR82_09610 [Caulobacteraceae bacterium]|nr:hypothetical protein [Caulobacteraceae bacterium]
MGPIDYVSGLLPTNDSIVQSVGQGMQLRAAYDQQQLLKQQQAAALAAQQKYEQDKAAALANPTPQAFAALAVNYPQHREAFKQGWEQLNTAQQQGELRDTSTIAAALQSGRPDVALSKIDERITAMKNGGQDTGALTFLRDQIQQDPRKAHGDVLNVLAGLPGGDKVLENLGKISTEARAAELQPSAVTKAAADAAKAGSDATTAAVTADFARPTAQAELDQKAAQLGLTKAQVRDINSQIGNRAAQLGLDRQKLQLEVDKFAFEKLQKAQDIGQDGRKLVNDSAVAAGAAKLSADRANDLANRITDIGSSWGAAGSFAEWLKRTTGEQGAVSQLRSEYTRLRNSEGLKNLPPGPATDKDIELALKGIPPETADPKVLQQFLRGVAKMNDINAAIENAKADFASNNKGLMRRAGSDFSAGGVPVKAGEDWTSVSKRVAAEAAKGYRPALAPAAAPAEPGASIRPTAPAPAGRPPLDAFFTPGT